MYVNTGIHISQARTQRQCCIEVFNASAVFQPQSGQACQGADPIDVGKSLDIIQTQWTEIAAWPNHIPSTSEGTQDTPQNISPAQVQIHQWWKVAQRSDMKNFAVGNW